ncbi:MAG: hypothetical protein HY752_04440 [Nitrospirae bacterium]|nr:hypothetical protein [Nitrospirota bacterium]
MILHPGVLSLIIGSLIVIVMMVYSSALGLKILKRWNIDSSSSEQLSLERKTYLISTIMNYVLGFMVLSAFLFIYTADDIHRLFIGAMCATGSLNANPVGWYVLYTKIIVFFLSSIWIAFNYIDQKAEDYPLVKTKYTILLFITPFIILDAYLQMRYFIGLKPKVITSCCGSLFSEAGKGIASSLSSLPVKPMMIIFYVTIGIFLLNALLSLRLRNSIPRYALTFLSLVVFVVSVASIISFISPYFYEIPTHHCPFDILQKNYYLIGYPIYITLFSGVFFGMITGILEPFKKLGSLIIIIEKSQKKWIALSILLILIFALISSWPMLSLSFSRDGVW